MSPAAFFSPSLTGSVPAICVLLLAAPVLEELVFRRGLHEQLLRRWPADNGPARATHLTTLTFGLAHALTRGPALGLAVLLPAWLIGRLYQRQRRVAGCTAVHAVFNLGWLMFGPAFLGSLHPALAS